MTAASCFCSNGNPAPQIETQIERHLLVARSSGMQPLAEIADALDQLALDERVHIFVGTVDERRLAPAALEDVVERGRDHLRFRVAEHADAGERLDPRQAARDVVFEEPLVEAKDDPNWKAAGSGSLLKRPDQRFAIGLLRDRSRLSSASSRRLPCACSPPFPRAGPRS